MTERKADLKFGVDATAVKPGLEQIKRDVKGMSEDVKRSGKEAGEGVEQIGGGSDKAAKKVESATRSMQASLERQIAAFASGSKSSREYQESLIKLRGADLAALKPLLDQLDAAKTKAEAAARANKQLGDSTSVAARDHDQLAGRINALGTAANFAKGQLLAMASSLSLGAMSAWVKHINDGVDALNDIKDATGASIESISALEDVGRRTGASFETVGSILVKFNDVLSKATPKSDIANAIKAIGLEADALKKMDPAEALRVTAVALSNYADDANKARLVQDLFGKSVKEAAPFLADLAAQGSLVARRTTEQAEAAETFNKKIFDLKATANELSRDMVSKMLPGLSQIVDEMSRAAKEGGALLAVWRGLKEFGSIAFGTDKLGTAMSDAKAQAAEIKRLDGILNGAVAVAEREPDNDVAQRRVVNLRKQIEATMKTAQAASKAVTDLVNPPAAPAPPQPPKPSVKTPKTAAELAAEAAAGKAAADVRKKALEDEAKLLAELAGLSGAFGKEWDVLNKAFASGKLTTEQLQAEQAKLLEKQPFMIALRKEETEAIKKATDAAKDRTDAHRKERDGIDQFLQSQEQLNTQTIKAVEDRIAAMELEDESAELAARHNITLAEAINRVNAARLRTKRDSSTGAYEGSDEYNRLTAEINVLEREADRLNTNDRNGRAREGDLRAKEEVDRYIEDTRRGLGDAVETAIFDGSKAGGEKMREVLQEALLRKPLRMVIDGVMNQVTGGLMNMIGLGGGGGVAGGAGGSGLGGLFSAGSSLYQGYTGLTSGQGVLGAIGNYFGMGAAASGTGVGASVTAVNGRSALQPVTIATNSSVIGGAGGAAGTAGGMSSMAMGGIVTAIMLAVINVLGGMRTETQIGSGLAGTLGGGKALTPWQEWREGGTLLSGPEFATHNPLEELSSKRAELQRLRDSGQGQTNYAVGLQANVIDLEKTTKGLATQTAVFDREITKGYKAYRSNVVDMANSLGLAGDSIDDFAYTLGAQDLNFQGLKPEEIQAKITETFGKAGTEMVQGILGSWKEVTDTIVDTWVDTTDPQNPVFTTETTVNKRQEYVPSEYAKVGETAIQTLERLATSFNTLNSASDALGFGLHEGSLSLAAFSEKFIEAFGGLERFAASTGSFLQNYYTGEERRQALLRSGAQKAEALGFKGVTAGGLEQLGRSGIRDLVNSMVGNPEEYRDAMDLANYLSPAFEAIDAQVPVVQELSTVVDELTQAYKNAIKSLTTEGNNLQVELLRAQGKDKEADALARQQYLDSFVDEAGNKLDATRLQEIAAKYDANEATRKYIKGIKEAAQAQLDALAKLRTDSIALIDTAAGATEAAFARYQASADKERDRLQGSIDSIRSVFDAASDGAKSFFDQVDSVVTFQGSEGRDFIAQALASAQTGGALPDGKKLSEAIEAVGKDFSATQYATQAEADFQKLVVANELKGLQEISGDQLTEAERQLKALDDQVRIAREQLDALRGIDSTLKDLPTALAELIAAYNTESRTRSDVKATALIGKGNAVYDVAKGIGTTSSGAYFEGEALRDAAIAAVNQGATIESIHKAIWESGFTIAQAETILGAVPGSLEQIAKDHGLKVFHDGTTYVPETQFALLQKGEAVIPTAHNPFKGWPSGGMGGSSARLEGLVAVLIERVSALEVPLTNIDSQTAEQRDLIDKVTDGGNSMKSDVMNEVTLA